MSENLGHRGKLDVAKVKLQPQWCRLGPRGTGCDDGGSTRLILYTKYKRGEGLTCDDGGSTRIRE